MSRTKDSGSGSISFAACLAFAVGTMVGGGVFALSGTAINDAGPAAILSYVMAAVVMLLSALSFVAVAARAKEGESGYEPMADLVGRRLRFLTMWGFVVNGALMIPFLLVAFGEHLQDHLLESVDPVLAGLVAITVLALLNLGSAQLVGAAETYVVATKIAILVFFVAVGLWHIGDASFTPFAPEGSSGVLSVAALLFTAYTGFNVVTNMAGSLEDPQRAVPRAVIGSLLIAMVIYVGVVVAMLASGQQHYGRSGLVQAAEVLIGSAGAEIIAVAACLSTLSGANAFLIATSELMHRQAGDGDIPAVVGSETNGRPLVSVGLLALLAVPGLWVDEDTLVAFAAVVALASMIVVNLSAIRLARAGWPGPGMRLPGGPVLPALAVVSCTAQFPSLGMNACVVGAALLVVGLLLYEGTRRGSAARPGRSAWPGAQAMSRG